MNWKRERPGLYRGFNGDEWVAQIERGAETGRWFWEWWNGAQYECAAAATLREAKDRVERIVRPPR